MTVIVVTYSLWQIQHYRLVWSKLLKASQMPTEIVIVLKRDEGRHPLAPKYHSITGGEYYSRIHQQPDAFRPSWDSSEALDVSRLKSCFQMNCLGPKNVYFKCSFVMSHWKVLPQQHRKQKFDCLNSTFTMQQDWTFCFVNFQ